MDESFKIAANSLAHFYKESVSQTKKSYYAGYEQSLQDIWEFIALKSSTESESIPVSELVDFIKSKHAETQQAAGLKHSEPQSGSNSGQIPNNDSAQGNPELKRRWGCLEVDLRNEMSVDESQFEQKRSRGTNE